MKLSSTFLAFILVITTTMTFSKDAVTPTAESAKKTTSSDESYKPNMVTVDATCRFDGQIDFPLTGIGLIAGLKGTGDSEKNLTKQALANLLEMLGLKVNIDDLVTKNIAIVSVSARVRHPVRTGHKLMAYVASIGDAKSLQNGILLGAALKGPDKDTWAVAVGTANVGYSEGSGGPGGESVTKNHPTAGIVPDGVIMIQDAGQYTPYKNGFMNIYLEKPNYITARRVKDAVNEQFPGIAHTKGSGTVQVMIPDSHNQGNTINDFISELLLVKYIPYIPPTIYINKGTGTVIIEGEVVMHPVIISKGSITVTIKNTQNVTTAAPLTGGDNTTTEDQSTKINETSTPIVKLPGSRTLNQLVENLKSLNISNSDIIDLLISLKDASAIEAKIIFY